MDSMAKKNDFFRGQLDNMTAMTAAPLGVRHCCPATRRLSHGRAKDGARLKGQAARSKEAVVRMFLVVDQ